jgi:hypothetical protein
MSKENPFIFYGLDMINISLDNIYSDGIRSLSASASAAGKIMYVLIGKLVIFPSAPFRFARIARQVLPVCPPATLRAGEPE